MAWIAAAISVVGSVVKTGIETEAAKKIQKNGGYAGQAGEMDLGKMLFQDSSMNNSGWIVTTNGSTANATANTERTTSPTTEGTLSQPLGLVGGTGGGGIDMNLILIAGAGLLLMRGGK